MGLKIVGLDNVIAMIQNDSDRATQQARRRMDAEAQKIMELSKEYCPVDKGNLEEAHHITTERDDRNRKVEIIEVGGVVGGVDVDEYATAMHEGSYNLGPKSAIKDGGSGKVGPKFLERALKEREPFLNAGLKEVVKDAL